MSEGDDADENERAEAEALRRALAGEALDEHAHELPEDALATAALLRHAGAGGGLPAERGEALLADLLGELQPAPAPRRVVRLWPWAAGLAAAAALALVWISLPALDAPMAAAPATAPAPSSGARALPVPSGALLAAQVELTREPGDSTRFEHEMQAYRTSLFRALHNAYPAPLSQLEAERVHRSAR